jgi:hypothetical protein
MGGVRDGYSNFRFFTALRPGVKTAQAYTGASIDRTGYETVTFVVHVDVFSVSANISTVSAYFLRMQHGESNTAGTVVWSNCVASQMLFDATMSGIVAAGQSHGLAYTTSTGSGTAEGVFLHFGISQSLVGSMESRCYAAGYVGTRRWVRVMMSCSVAADQSEVALGVLAILGLPGQWPVNVIARTND